MPAVKARRRKASAPEPKTRDVFVIVDEAGAAHGRPVEFPAGAITRAQTLALDWPGHDPVTFYVKRQSLFGPDAVLYRIMRDEQGTVWTKIISEED